MSGCERSSGSMSSVGSILRRALISRRGCCAHRNETKAAADQYERLEGQRSGFQITFAFVFILVAMLFLVSAVAVGIHVAGRLVDPIAGLIAAAEQVRAGDLSTRVQEGRKPANLRR